VVVHQVNPEYARVFGVRLARGRRITDRDVAARERVAVVNEAFVRRFSADRDPIGRVIRIPELGRLPFDLPGPPSFEIVGVVKDLLNQADEPEIEPEAYLPYTVAGRAEYLVVAARGNPAALAGAIREQVHAVDANQPVMNVMTLAQLLDEQFFSYLRFKMVLFSVFAGLGCTLAVLGVHGVISHVVAQQTREIGLRMALGAGTGDIFRMVMGRGARLLVIGIAIGLVAGVAATRLLATKIEVREVDPGSFAAASILLFGAGVAGCYWPARRAARLDPMVSLRRE
jgi:hypothetical protein